MVTFKLIPYSINIKRENSSDFLILDDLEGVKKTLTEQNKKTHPYSPTKFTPKQLIKLQKTDLFFILQNYFKSLKDPKIIKDYQKTISIDKSEQQERNIFGIVKGGEYGISADHLDINSLIRKPEARKITDSEELPFFIHINIPKDRNQGYIIFETIGVHGIEVLFEGDLNNYLRKFKYSISFNRMVSSNLFNEINMSILKEIKLIKRIVPKDIADKVHDGDAKDIIEERIFKAARNKNLILPSGFLEKIHNKNITSYEFLNDHFSEIKAVIRQKKNIRTATFSIDTTKMGELMYLGDVKLENGYPNFETLKQISIQYMNDLTNTHN